MIKGCATSLFSVLTYPIMSCTRGPGSPLSGLYPPYSCLQNMSVEWMDESKDHQRITLCCLLGSSTSALNFHSIFLSVKLSAHHSLNVVWGVVRGWEWPPPKLWSTRHHSLCLLADTADPHFLLLLVGAAALADVELTVLTTTLGVDQEGEGWAAAHAAVFHKLLVLWQDAALTAFLIQLLLHLTGNTAKDGGKKKSMLIRGVCVGSLCPRYRVLKPSHQQSCFVASSCRTI